MVDRDLMNQLADDIRDLAQLRDIRLTGILLAADDGSSVIQHRGISTESFADGLREAARVVLENPGDEVEIGDWR